MNYADATLLRLTDEQSRAGLFDEMALEHLLRAAYETSSLSVDKPYRPVFEAFSLGFSVQRQSTLDGTWCQVGSVDKVEARFQLLGGSESSPVAVDAIWRGSIVAQTVS